MTREPLASDAPAILRAIESAARTLAEPLAAYPTPDTTWHYIGEDTKRRIMFDPARLEAERLERAKRHRRAIAVSERSSL